MFGKGNMYTRDVNTDDDDARPVPSQALMVDRVVRFPRESSEFRVHGSVVSNRVERLDDQLVLVIKKVTVTRHVEQHAQDEQYSQAGKENVRYVKNEPNQGPQGVQTISFDGTAVFLP
jgi:hypothetical protein